MDNLILEYKKKIAVHPGYYIKELIEDKNMTQDEFAKRLGTTPKTISKLINGKTSLSADLAIKLANMLGTSIEMWTKFQNSYDELINEQEKDKLIAAQEKLMKKIDYSYFMKIGLVEDTKIISDKITNLCKSLGVANLEVFQEKDYYLNCRAGITKFTEENVLNSRLWIEAALKVGENIPIKNNFNKEKILEYIPTIRSLITKTPEEFIPRLKEIFSECGIVFILLPHLKNSGVNGAVKWITSDKVIIAMNDRKKYADVFWFSLFHEIKHVLQQKINLLILSQDKEDLNLLDKKLEEEADEFAKQILIPAEKFNDFKEKKDFSEENIIAFAREINIIPGIVLGRLQKEGILNYKTKLNSLKISYNLF